MHSDLYTLMQEVGTWHREVFGTHNTFDHVRAIAQKAEEEAKELGVASTHPLAYRALQLCREEIADMFICALAAADRLCIDPTQEIRKKFAVVKARTDQLARDRARGIVQAGETCSDK